MSNIVVVTSNVCVICGDLAERPEKTGQLCDFCAACVKLIPDYRDKIKHEVALEAKIQFYLDWLEVEEFQPTRTAVANTLETVVREALALSMEIALAYNANK